MEISENEILILKSQDSDNAPDNYVTILQENGFEAKFLKVLIFQNVNLKVLKTKLEDPDNYAGLIFTSPRSIQATKEALGSSSLSLDWTSKQNYVIGEKTKSLAADLLCLNCLGETTGNANCLSKEIITRSSKVTLPFLFPCGNIKRDVLKTELLKQGLLLDEVTVYETQSNPKIEDELEILTNSFRRIPKVVVYFSPSGVGATKKILERNQLVDKIMFVAIGPTTAEAIEKNGWSLAGFAEKPTPDSLLKVIQNL